MSRKLKVGMAIAGVAVAVPVASVLGRGAGQPAGPGQSAAKSSGVETSAVHQVGAPSSPGLKAGGGHHGSKLKLAYFETPRKNVKPGQSGLVVGPVPKKCLVLNGYYFVPGNIHTTGVLSMGDSPAGLRKWAFYRDNEDNNPVKGVKYGVICAKPAGVLTG